MISNIEKTRSSNEIFINRDENCSGMIASNISGHTSY